MDIKTIGRYLWRELHRGNLLVIAVIIFSWIWIAVPTYQKVESWLKGHDDATAYIMQDLNVLREELQAIKQDTRVQLVERQSGTIGTTRH